MRIRLRPFGLLVAMMLLAFSSVLEAQRPELYYYRFNETSGVTTNDLANPGLPGVTAIVTNGAVFNSNLQRLGAACVNTIPATGAPVQTNKVFTASGDWSVEIWAFDNDNSDPTALRYLFGDQTANSFRCFRGGIAGANNIAFRMTGMNDVIVPGGAPFATWAHLCFVNDSRARTVTPYLNGVALPAVPQTNALPILGTATSGLDIGGYNTAVPWRGLIDEFRFWNRALTPAEVAGQMNIQLKNEVNEMAVTSVTAPLSDQVGCSTFSAAETISFEIENTGTTAMAAGTTFQASYTINGGTPVTETFMTTTTSLTIGQKELFSFATPANLAAVGTYTIDVSIVYGPDLIPLNNANQRIASSGGENLVSTFPWIETFDSVTLNGSQLAPLGWRQDPADGAGADADWYFRNISTPTGGTGPSSDHTGGGYYAHVEDDGNFAAVNLISPCIDLSSLPNPRVKFFVHSNNPAFPTGENFLSLDVISFPGGTVTMDVLGPIGHIGTSWSEVFVDIPAFSGQIVQLRFRGRSDGGSNSHDIAIDDLAVFNYVPGTGQPPQAAIAVLDINAAQSPGLSGVGSLDNGPYTTTIPGGDIISFEMKGEANQPVVLLFGALNPAIASFPGIGQLDIGGPIDPMTGIPTLIQVFADGTIPMGFNPFFNTGPAAENSVYFTMPPFPSGPLTTFQGIYFWTGGVAISNAVEILIP